jgi:hypothetical protein
LLPILGKKKLKRGTRYRREGTFPRRTETVTAQTTIIVSFAAIVALLSAAPEGALAQRFTGKARGGIAVPEEQPAAVRNPALAPRHGMVTAATGCSLRHSERLRGNNNIPAASAQRHLNTDAQAVFPRGKIRRDLLTVRPGLARLQNRQFRRAKSIDGDSERFCNQHPSAICLPIQCYETQIVTGAPPRLIDQ